MTVRTTLTISQRLWIIAKHQRRKTKNATWTQKQITFLAKETLTLVAARNQPTISRILHARCEWTAQYSYRHGIKESRLSNAPKPVRQPYRLICSQIASSFALPRPAVWKLAEMLQSGANKIIDSDAQLQVNFSNAGLAIFKHRYDLKICKVHDEIGSA